MAKKSKVRRITEEEYAEYLAKIQDESKDQNC